MKKLLFSLLCLLVSTTAMAEFRWGPTAGVNFSKFEFKQDLITVDRSTGFNAGVQGELMFPGIGFGIDFGLNYQMHGSKIHFGEKEVWASDGIGSPNVTLHTIQIPINLRFKYTNLNGIEKKIAPFVYGGPVFSIIAGHNDVKPLEYSHGYFGLQCGLGAELFKNLQISGGYYWDMTYEIRTIKLSNFSGKAQGWNISLTYFIK